MIKNQSIVEVEVCDDKKVEFKSEEIETTPIKLKIKKEHDCDVVAIGEKIHYTVHIENECSTDVKNVLFKDHLDPCTKFVEGSFKVNEHEHHPEIEGHTITYRISEIESCQTVKIEFDVETTEECCTSCHMQSQAPTILPLVPLTTAVLGTGVPSALIKVTFPGGECVETNVNNLRSWRVTAPHRLHRGEVVTAIQIEPGKSPSNPVTRTVR